MNIIINPGSGPVADAAVEHARAAIEAFVRDLRTLHDIEVRTIEDTGEQDEGRWRFLLHAEDERQVEVEMPGLPVEQVRWMDEEGQNIWHFPRLYVDGSSWVWKFALSACQPEEEETP